MQARHRRSVPATIEGRGPSTIIDTRAIIAAVADAPDDPDLWRKREILHAVRALSADANSQLAYIAPIGPGILWDEVEDVEMHIADLEGSVDFSIEARALLARIDACFKGIDDDDERWTEDAIRLDPVWTEIRELGRRLLDALPNEIRGIEPPAREAREADLLLRGPQGSFALFLESCLHVTIDASTGDTDACLGLRAVIETDDRRTVTRWLGTSSFVRVVLSMLRSPSFMANPPIADPTAHLVVARTRNTILVTLADLDEGDRASITLRADRATRLMQASRLSDSLERLLA